MQWPKIWVWILKESFPIAIANPPFTSSMFLHCPWLHSIFLLQIAPKGLKATNVTSLAPRIIKYALVIPTLWHYVRVPPRKMCHLLTSTLLKESLKIVAQELTLQGNYKYLENQFDSNNHDIIIVFSTHFFVRLGPQK